MTGPDVKVPTNIFYFEVLLYLSLLIDVLSAAFMDRVSDDISESTRLAVNLIAVMMTLGFMQLIWLAAHRRKNWARMVLLAAMMLSVASIATSIGETGLQFSTFVDIVSTALTALGLSCSFTGDAQGWFQQPE
ncbi:hypothetical protein [Afipia clevelandensis]|uniref:Uncharacterized protein n=1 Tax=Afipia clevelandensis ATCC 49720 TaxID=883079 RepID=K8PB71_9BRAD|nr:hypothetical protein [Afipia clevelandensis]EKS38786.1 hypothetical protein HMPREF9696_01255 [Afipia clevelandensis ATCC 49720]